MLLVLCFWPREVTHAADPTSYLTVAVAKDDYITAGPRKNLGIYPLNVNIAECLTTFDEHFNIQPGLATSWEYLGEGRWRFHLRPGVKFHDGSPLDARAVRQSLARQEQIGATFFNCQKIEEVSAEVIDIVTRDRNRLLPYILSHPYLGILKDGHPPVGTGPFVMQTYRRDQYLAVKRNEDYWGDKPQIPGIIFRFIPDPAQRLLALQSGEVEVAVDIPWDFLAPVRGNTFYRLYLSPPGTYLALMISSQGPLQDQELRQIIASSLDRKAMAEVLWHGQADIRQTLIPVDLLGPDANLMPDIPFRPEEAQKKLQGRKLSLTLVAGFPNAQAHGELPEIIQAQLKKIGLEVRVLKINDAGLYHAFMKEGKGDLWLERGNQNNADPTFLPYLLFHPEGFYPKILHTAPGSPRFCQLLEAARSSGDLENLRKHLALALQELIHQQILVIPIATLPQVIITHKRVILERVYPSLLSMRWDRIVRQ